MAIGFVIALSLTGVIRSLLVSMTPNDPITFASISLLFLMVVVVSALIPALRAARWIRCVAIRQT